MTRLQELDCEIHETFDPMILRILELEVQILLHLEFNYDPMDY